jgi:hypothetical protein
MSNVACPARLPAAFDGTLAQDVSVATTPPTSVNRNTSKKLPIVVTIARFAVYPMSPRTGDKRVVDAFADSVAGRDTSGWIA